LQPGSTLPGQLADSEIGHRNAAPVYARAAFFMWLPMIRRKAGKKNPGKTAAGSESASI
jgi:hypothetical protein